jgi:SAM-dependent methyltransferase
VDDRLAREGERILAAYAARRERVERGEVDALRYTGFTPGYLFSHQLLVRRVARLLTEYGLRPLTGRRILDVGCGDGVIGESEGVHLHELLAYGARPEDLFGIDLQPEAIARGRALLPGATLSVGSAESLPYPDGFFDLVAQSTVFSSILDDIMRRRVAAEMRRVVRPGGLILWYDFRVNNPWNLDIRRVTRPEVRALFEGCACRFWATTLAHPVARVVARHTWLGAYLLERVPWLRTHDLAAIRPTGSASRSGRSADPRREPDAPADLSPEGRAAYHAARQSTGEGQVYGDLRGGSG